MCAEGGQSDREVGAVLAVLTMLITWVIMPLRGEWSRLGDELRPNLTVLAKLEARAGRHAMLVARREQLVRKLGVLVEGEAPPEDKKKK